MKKRKKSKLEKEIEIDRLVEKILDKGLDRMDELLAEVDDPKLKQKIIEAFEKNPFAANSPKKAKDFNKGKQ